MMERIPLMLFRVPCKGPSSAMTSHVCCFPVCSGVAGGINWLKAVGAAMPMLKINPTSGTDLSNAADVVKAGAWSLGFVAPLFDPTDVANQVPGPFPNAPATALDVLQGGLHPSPPLNPP